MTPLIIWTFAIAGVTAIACALCGVYLVIKREAFVSEGLSHAVLPGIILAYIVIPDRSSPWLVIAAGLSGLIMVWLTQLLTATRRVEKDAALGIVFSGLFSVGIIASNLNLKNVHFHAHCIIDGNLSFAPLEDFVAGGVYLGPKAFVMMTLMLIALVLFITLFYKEMKLASFDQVSAGMFGFRPRLLHSFWLALVSMTAVAAFETAGTVLVVALMIAPPATANLLTTRLSRMLIISPVLAVLGAATGTAVGIGLDISHAGPICTASGLIFVAVLLVSKDRPFFRRRTAATDAVS